MNPILISLLLAGQVGSAVASAQSPTIPEVASRASGPFHTGRIRELAPVPFGQMVRQADLIIRGTVTPIRTYLSSDQTEIYTDYRVTPVRTIAARASRPVPARPGLQEIIVKHFGGRMTFGNVTADASDGNLPPFEDGSELVLFLVFDGQESRYRILGDVSGAFSVHGERVAPLLKPPLQYERFRGMSVGDFVSAIAKERQAEK